MSLKIVWSASQDTQILTPSTEFNDKIKIDSILHKDGPNWDKKNTRTYLRRFYTNKYLQND